MRSLTFILGAAAAIGMAAAISAAPAQDRVQLAQAQPSGTQSDTGAGANQRGNAGNRQGGGATGQTSQGGKASGGKASGGDRASVRTEGTSRTSVREHSEGSRVSVHGGRSHVGVRTAERDDAVVVKRKKALRYVYDEPALVIKKKRHYVSHGEPSHTVVTKERRGGVAVSGGVSTHTNVHTRSGSTTVGASSTTHSNGGKGANARSSGQGGGNSGGSTGGSTGQSRGNKSGSSGGGEAPGQR